MEPVPQARVPLPDVARADAERPENSQQALVGREAAWVRNRDVIKDKDREEAGEKAVVRASKVDRSQTTETHNFGRFLNKTLKEV